MIQEKDFINKASIKTAQVRMSDGQISTPEILVTEKGDFTGGNILDANSVAELINSSSASGDYVQYSAKSTEDYTIPLQFIVANNINQGTTKISSAGIHHSDQGDLDFCKGTLVFEQNDKTFGMAFDNQEDKYDYTISANDSDDRFHFNKDIAIPGCISLRAALQSKQDKGNYLEFDSIENDGFGRIVYNASYDKVVTFGTKDTKNISLDAQGITVNDLNNDYVYIGESKVIACNGITNEEAYVYPDRLVVQDVNNDRRLTIGKYGITTSNLTNDVDENAENLAFTADGSMKDLSKYVTIEQFDKKMSVIDGDSNTEGSFRKAIADVVAAAPEDLDTLKEIADKLAGNDDLHTALNQAITEKADASALANEVTRATGVENDLKASIATKQDKPAEGKAFLQVEVGKGAPEIKEYPLVFGDQLGNYATAQRDGFLVYYMDGTGYHKIVNISSTGIEADDERRSDTKVWNTNGGITDLANYALNSDVAKKLDKKADADMLSQYVNSQIIAAEVNLKKDIAKKQDKITANTIDITGIETADISKLRTIVSNLLDALGKSGLIKQNVGL